MNIIISEELHNNLQKYIVSTIEFGSALKGEKNENSDSDYLHIIESVDWMVSSVVANQHLLQFKTENEDHIYCNAHTFVKSLLDGDTTIFLEMHKYGGLNNTCLEFLNKYNFTFYNTLRAYLGISRRDINDVRKLWKNRDELIRKINKKLKFAEQGVFFVIDYFNINKNLMDDIEFENFLKEFYMIYEEISKFKESEYVVLSKDDHFDKVNSVSRLYNDLIELTRNYLNKCIEKKYFNKTFEKEEFLEIVKDLNNNIKIITGMRECENEVMSRFYDSYTGNV